MKILIHIKNTIFFGLLFFLISCTKTENPIVKFETELGNIIIELNMKQAPKTCNNFIEYIEKNLFEGAMFYRVVRIDNQPDNDIKIEVIQGGLLLDDDVYLLPAFEHESTKETGILHKDGVISMARLEPGTASSEFFICIGDQPELDYGGKRNPDLQGFAAFGKVVNGMEIVRRINQLADTNQFLINQVKITSIKIVN